MTKEIRRTDKHYTHYTDGSMERVKEGLLLEDKNREFYKEKDEVSIEIARIWRLFDEKWDEKREEYLRNNPELAIYMLKWGESWPKR